MIKKGLEQSDTHDITTMWCLMESFFGEGLADAYERETYVVDAEFEEIPGRCPRCGCEPLKITQDMSPPYFVMSCCGVEVRGRDRYEVERNWLAWSQSDGNAP
jgi:hypothetical protein